MSDSGTITIAASLPVNVTPSSTQIVFCPDTNSYALQIGVTVQLPITELVEVLLKFNAEHVVSTPVTEVDSSTTHSLLASLPDASPYSLPDSPSVYTPKVAHAGTKRARETGSGKFANDDFARIPIGVARQDPMVMEYRERSKWRRESGRFFIEDSLAKEQERVEKLEQGFKCFEELLVNEHFLAPVAARHSRASSMDASAGFDSVYTAPVQSKQLSADAPVFTPGSGFASTYAPDSGASSRQRSMSDAFIDQVAGRSERIMSAASFLPPAALPVPEGIETPDELAAPGGWTKPRGNPWAVHQNPAAVEKLVVKEEVAAPQAEVPECKAM